MPKLRRSQESSRREKFDRQAVSSRSPKASPLTNWFKEGLLVTVPITFAQSWQIFSMILSSDALGSMREYTSAQGSWYCRVLEDVECRWQYWSSCEIFSVTVRIAFSNCTEMRPRQSFNGRKRNYPGSIDYRRSNSQTAAETKHHPSKALKTTSMQEIDTDTALCDLNPPNICLSPQCGLLGYEVLRLETLQVFRIDRELKLSHVSAGLKETLVGILEATEGENLPVS